jgi:2-oxoglutarate-Fe(II)-dependent oxygenase superfamily protein
VSSAFTSILETTAGTRDGKYRLKRTNPNYDAQMLPMSNALAPSFDPFFSGEWLRSLFDLAGLPELAQIDGALHSSPRGSRDGWIHTDHCSGWFDDGPAQERVFPDRNRCNYFTGEPKTPEARPVEYVRAVTMIYYLCNDGWRQGDGGETGLYPAARVGSRSPAVLVPPIDNSAFVFECSPHSYHRFVANPGRTRNSIILWLHATVQQAESMWGSAVNRRAPR